MGIKTSGLPQMTGFGSSDDFIACGPAGTGRISGEEAAEFFRDSLRISRPNLLDNPDFTINQRGVSGTISTPGYFLDRWKLTSGSVTISSGGITLNGTIQQILETAPSGTLTASYLTNSGVQKAPYDSASKTFSITATNTLIKAAKLELGSVQTLAHLEGSTWVLNDPPPNKALELAKCQGYFYRLAPGGSNNLFLGGNIANTANTIFCPVFLPAPMRSSPSLVLSENNILGMSKAGSASKIPSTKISKHTMSKDYRIAVLSIGTGSALTPGEPYEISLNEGSYIDFNADL